MLPAITQIIFLALTLLASVTFASPAPLNHHHFKKSCDASKIPLNLPANQTALTPPTTPLKYVTAALGVMVCQNLFVVSSWELDFSFLFFSFLKKKKELYM